MEDQTDELREVARSNERNNDVDFVRLLEMSKVRKARAGLPVDIWVDEGKTFSKSKHFRHIKFQGDKGDPNTRNWVPLTVSDDPRIPVKDVEHDLNERELDQVKRFVVLNKDLLLRLGDDFDVTDFVMNMRLV